METHEFTLDDNNEKVLHVLDLGHFNLKKIIRKRRVRRTSQGGSMRSNCVMSYKLSRKSLKKEAAKRSAI